MLYYETINDIPSHYGRGFGFLKTLLGGSTIIFGGLNDGTPIELAQQTEVESLKSSVSEGKSLIASAITDKGVSTSSTATFQTMATNIKNIKTTTTIIQQVNGILENTAGVSLTSTTVQLYNNGATERISISRGILFNVSLNDYKFSIYVFDLKNSKYYYIYSSATSSYTFRITSSSFTTGMALFNVPHHRGSACISAYTSTSVTIKCTGDYGCMVQISY